MAERLALYLLAGAAAVSLLLGQVPAAAAGLFGLLSAAVAVLYRSLPARRLHVTVRLEPARTFPHRRAHLVVQIDHAGILPWLGVQVIQPLPPDWRWEEGEPETPPVIAFRTRLGPRQRAVRRYPVQVGSRMRGPLPPAVYRWTDPLGLLSGDATSVPAHEVVVYPAPQATPVAPPPPEPQGHRRTAGWLYPDPLEIRGLTEADPHTPGRDIHWPATARAGRLMRKQYAPLHLSSLLLFLLLPLTRDEGPAAVFVPREQVEGLLSAAAFLAVEAGRRRMPVGLYATGVIRLHTLSVRLPPARGPHQVQRILTALAGLQPVPPQLARASRLGTALSAAAAPGATVYALAPYFTAEDLHFLDRLAARGCRVRVASYAPLHLPRGLRLEPAAEGAILP